MTSEKVEIDLEEECCGICRFRKDNLCKRRAPAGGTYGGGKYGISISYDKWPWTPPTDWCGEFEKEVQ